MKWKITRTYIRNSSFRQTVVFVGSTIQFLGSKASGAVANANFPDLLRIGHNLA